MQTIFPNICKVRPFLTLSFLLPGLVFADAAASTAAPSPSTTAAPAPIDDQATSTPTKSESQSSSGSATTPAASSVTSPAGTTDTPAPAASNPSASGNSSPTPPAVTESYGSTVVPSLAVDPTIPAKKVDKNGRPLMIGSTALWGAYTMGTLGYIGQRPEVGVPLGLGLGAMLGGGGAYLITAGRDISSSEAGYLVTSQVLGGLIGLVPVAFYQELLEGDVGKNQVRKARSTLAPFGSGMGLLISTLAPVHQNSTLAIGATAGVLGNAGVQLLWAPTTEQAALRASVVGTSVGLAEMAGTVMIQSGHRLTQNDQALAWSLFANAAWSGFWLPYIFTPEPDPSQRWGALSVAGSAGLISSLAVSSRVEFNKPQVTALNALGLSGQTIGAGIPMLTGALNDTENKPEGILLTASSQMIGHGAGLVVGGLMHDRFEDSSGVFARSILGATIGAAQAGGIGYSFYSSSKLSSSEFGGLALTSAGIGSAVATLAPPTERTKNPTRALILASSFGWGAWYAAWGGVAANLSGPDVLLLSTLGADFGALAGMGLSSKALALSPRRTGYVSLCGIAGVATADVSVLLVASDAQTLGIANLVGPTAGILVGIATARLIPENPKQAFNLDGPTGRRLAALQGEVQRWHPTLEAAPMLEPSLPDTQSHRVAQVQLSESAPWGIHLRFTQPAH